MKNFDNIEDWYRNELNNYNVEPDTHGWNALAEDLDTTTPLTDENISEWYKKEVAKLEERPDYTVWEKLATQLDTSSVWDKLAVSLYKYDQLIWWRNLAIRGSAIFLLLFSSYLTYHNFSKSNNTLLNNNTLAKNKNSKSIHKKNTNQQNILNQVNSSFIKPTLLKKKNIKPVSKQLKDQKNAKNTFAKNVSIAIHKTKANLITKSNKESIENNTLYASTNKIPHFKSLTAHSLNSLKTNKIRTTFTTNNKGIINNNEFLNQQKNSKYLVKKKENKIVFNKSRFSSISMFGVYSRRFYAGFNVGIKKQGMITTLKENTNLNIYTHSLLPDFGNNFGGLVGFIVNDNLNIEANLNLNSTAGYKKSLDNEGKHYTEDLNLNYTTLSLLAKKMNTKSTFDNKVYSTNFIGGLYASYLRTSSLKIDGSSTSLDAFNKTDYGVVLGIEQDRYITKTLVVTPGIRYNQGFINIANPSSDYSSAFNFSLELNIGVKYIFLKKGN